MSFRCFFENSKCVFMSLHWREDWVLPHPTIKPRTMECCSGFCPSVDFSYLHIWSWSSTRVTIRFLVTTLTKALLHQLLSLARWPALGRVLVVSNVFHLRLTETTCFCDSSMKQIFFLNSSTDVWLDATLFLSSTDCSFDLRAWFLRWYALSAVRPFIKMRVPFQIIPIQLNLPQVNFTRSVVSSVQV